jgi:hypothetical protein
MTPRCAAMSSIWRAHLSAIGIGLFTMLSANASAQQPFVPQPGIPSHISAQAGYTGPFSGQPGALTSIPGTKVNVQVMPVGDRTQFSCPYTPQGQFDFSARNKVQLSIEITAAPQFGYRPIAFTVRAQQPATFDRQIRIAFHAGTWGYRWRAMTITQRLTIPRGQREATARALFPQYQDWQICGWETVVDGGRDEELSFEQYPFANQQMGYGVSAMLVAEGGTPWQSQSALQALATVTAPHIRQPSELPESWLEYSGYDIVAVDAALLPKIAAGEPRRHEALTRWLRSGGNLWVFNCGRGWQRIEMVDEALGLPNVNRPSNEIKESDDANASIVRRGWRFAPLNERALDPIEGALLLSGYDLGEPVERKPAAPTAVATGADMLQAIINTANRRQVTSEEVFAIRELGLGTIAAFRANSSGLTNSDAAIAVQQSVLLPRITATTRFGNKPDEANSEFNNWLIPGVGVAPVGMFQFLITLFALAIGPLNYWWLKRRKALPLLLATVPATAAVVTLLLLAYGTLSDGLGTRVRARSLTLIDQRSGEATSWGRLSYFAGVKPRAGLTFPTDVAVYPVLSNWSVGRYGNARELERSMSWGRTQRLTNGWLPSRTPTQYLSVTARASKKRLAIKPVADGVQVDNRLDVNVTHLVVQDRSGKLYWLEDLPAGERKIAAESDALDVSGKIRKLFADSYPEYPPGAEPSVYSGGYSASTMSQGLLEANLEAINSPMVERWIDGSYIAVTERGVELDLGLADVREESSFHVVRGLW